MVQTLNKSLKQPHRFIHIYIYHTVNGRSLAPVDMGNLPVFTEFYTSQVVQDFFHQQYEKHIKILCCYVCTIARGIQRVAQYSLLLGISSSHETNHLHLHRVFMCLCFALITY